MTPERRATATAMATAATLATTKLTIGLFSGSMSVLASATDSLWDFFVSFINFLAVGKSEDPEDHEHNYGHGKIEGFAALFEWIVVAGWAMILTFFSFQKIISKTWVEKLDGGIIAMIISLVATFFLIQYLRKIIKQTNSLVIRADELHYRTDLLTNWWVLICLCVIKFFPNLFMIDSIVSIAISVYILISAFGIIKEGFHMLMDGSVSTEVQERILQIILAASPRIHSHHCLRTRVSGKTTFVDMHLVFDTDISLVDAHDIADAIEKKIEALIPGAITTIHLDPRDDSKK